MYYASRIAFIVYAERLSYNKTMVTTEASVTLVTAVTAATVVTAAAVTAIAAAAPEVTSTESGRQGGSPANGPLDETER